MEKIEENRNKDKRYIGYLSVGLIEIMTELDEEEVCSYVTHFGSFGEIYIFDKYQREYILLAHGRSVQRWYPFCNDRAYAGQRAKLIYYLFDDYKYQRKLKYPKGRLKDIYKIVSMIPCV